MEVTLVFNQEELNNLSWHLDQSVRAGGLNAAKTAMVLVEKFEAAVAAVNEAAKTNTKASTEI